MACSKCGHSDGSHLPFPEVWQMINDKCNTCIGSFEIYQIKLKQIKENEKRADLQIKNS